MNAKMSKLLYACLMICLALDGYTQTLIRGPYLQSGTPGSMIIRWRTDQPTNSRLSFGATPQSLDRNVNDNAQVTEHEIKLTGLSPRTRYFYAIGSSTTTYQGDGSNFFETSPEVGQSGKYRFGIFGDCGTNSAIQAQTRDQLTAYLGNDYMNAWLLLGDNAYSFGFDTEYQSNFFNHYKDKFMKTSPIFPSPGNHDYELSFQRQQDHNMAYYKVFTMPTAGEAGGVPSGNEAYYSFDYGNVHFLSLDSYGLEDQTTRMYDTLGRQAQWVKADLAANKNKDWVVAYWHHPPYTKGSHDSDKEGELAEIRKNFITILERYGVDLIICGHSHVYERSRIMGGHYQNADTFNPQMHNQSTSSGKYDGSPESCPYIKTESNKGTVYVVAGSTGQFGGTSAGYPHKAMYYSNNSTGGTMMLEVEGNRLDAKWITQGGAILDKFTMFKNVNKTKSNDLEYGEKITLSASFTGKYAWNNGETGKSVTVAPTTSGEFKVTDEFNCVADIFKINVSKPLTAKLLSFSGSAAADNTVSLKWATGYEVNSSQFIIERSINGTDFTEVAKVPAAKNSSEQKNYEWLDPTSASITNLDTVHYRLKIPGPDDKSTYSNVVTLKIKLVKLPFKLVSLTGSADAGNAVTLKWITELEVNSSHFIVERAVDGVNFEEVAKVPAAKNSSQPKSYEWLDETSANIINQDTLFYRLKMVDLNNESQSSKTLAVKIQRINKSMDIEVVPNPALADEIQIRLVGKTRAEGKIVVTDQGGKIRSSRQITLTTKLVSFMPENTPPGVYFVKFFVEGDSFVKKVVVF
jgi:UDP-2,3-diacylglucosamine pyrophosphatase LpxH